MDGFRRLGAMQMSAALAAATSDPFPASYTERVRKIGVVNPKNRRLTNIVAKLLDGPDWLRRWMIDRFIVEDYKFDPADVRRRGARKFHSGRDDRGVHATCTCRMGADGDPMAVTDTQAGCAASPGCAWSTPRCSRRCPAPTPISRP